jgi:hypothetical protein
LNFDMVDINVHPTCPITVGWTFMSTGVSGLNFDMVDMNVHPTGGSE